MQERLEPYLFLASVVDEALLTLVEDHFCATGGIAKLRVVRRIYDLITISEPDIPASDVIGPRISGFHRRIFGAPLVGVLVYWTIANM